MTNADTASATEDGAEPKSKLTGHLLAIWPLFENSCGRFRLSFEKSGQISGQLARKDFESGQLGVGNDRKILPVFTLIANKSGLFGPFCAHKLEVAVRTGQLATYFLKLFCREKRGIYRKFVHKVGFLAKWPQAQVFGHCPRILNMGYNERDEMSVIKLTTTHPPLFRN